MKLVCTKNGEYININKIVLVTDDNDKYYIFVHLYLNEFRKYEILHKTYLRLIHDYTI